MGDSTHLGMRWRGRLWILAEMQSRGGGVSPTEPGTPGTQGAQCGEGYGPEMGGVKRKHNT